METKETHVGFISLGKELKYKQYRTFALYKRRQLCCVTNSLLLTAYTGSAFLNLVNMGST